jgi:hypothetical protein
LDDKPGLIWPPKEMKVRKKKKSNRKKKSVFLSLVDILMLPGFCHPCFKAKVLPLKHWHSQGAGVWRFGGADHVQPCLSR